MPEIALSAQTLRSKCAKASPRWAVLTLIARPSRTIAHSGYDWLLVGFTARTDGLRKTLAMLCAIAAGGQSPGARAGLQ